MKKYIKIVSAILIIVLMATSLTGCQWLDSILGRVQGELIGQNFTITAYSNYGDKILDAHGSKVTIGLLENSANSPIIEEDGSTSNSSGFKSEVLDITINGKQMFSVGETLLFEEKGVDLITGYEIPTSLNASSGGGLVPVDTFINSIQNLIGKKMIVIVLSQMGTPIGVYQGKNVFVEIPDDLPKMTRLNIDGKSVYIHRANYVIADMELIKGE